MLVGHGSTPWGWTALAQRSGELGSGQAIVEVASEMCSGPPGDGHILAGHDPRHEREGRISVHGQVDEMFPGANGRELAAARARSADSSPSSSNSRNTYTRPRMPCSASHAPRNRPRASGFSHAPIPALADCAVGR
jgi:hypothetical protein